MALSVILHLRKLWEDFLLLPRDFNYRHVRKFKLFKNCNCYNKVLLIFMTLVNSNFLNVYAFLFVSLFVKRNAVCR